MDQTTDTSLRLIRRYPIEPTEMWEIWTDPSKISDWHRPNRTDFTTIAKADVRVGGNFSISMTSQDGTHTALGVFKEVLPPKRLVYIWQWENDPTNEVSEVTVEFNKVEDGTELVLLHERLSGPQSVEQHKLGWLGCLENIKGIKLKEK